jgi:hypothetical protein
MEEMVMHNAGVVSSPIHPYVTCNAGLVSKFYLRKCVMQVRKPQALKEGHSEKLAQLYVIFVEQRTKNFKQMSTKYIENNYKFPCQVMWQHVTLKVRFLP